MTQICQVNTLLTLLHGALKALKEGGKQLDEARMERVFLFCLTWALGGLLDVKERPALDAELRAFGSNLPPRGDEGDTIFEYLVNDAGET